MKLNKWFVMGHFVTCNFCLLEVWTLLRLRKWSFADCVLFLKTGLFLLNWSVIIAQVYKICDSSWGRELSITHVLLQGPFRSLREEKAKNFVIRDVRTETRWFFSISKMHNHSPLRNVFPRTFFSWIGTYFYSRMNLRRIILLSRKGETIWGNLSCVDKRYDI